MLIFPSFHHLYLINFFCLVPTKKTYIYSIVSDNMLLLLDFFPLRWSMFMTISASFFLTCLDYHDRALLLLVLDKKICLLLAYLDRKQDASQLPLMLILLKWRHVVIMVSDKTCAVCVIDVPNSTYRSICTKRNVYEKLKKTNFSIDIEITKIWRSRKNKMSVLLRKEIVTVIVFCFLGSLESRSRRATENCSCKCLLFWFDSCINAWFLVQFGHCWSNTSKKTGSIPRTGNTSENFDLRSRKSIICSFSVRLSFENVFVLLRVILNNKTSLGKSKHRSNGDKKNNIQRN